MNYNKIIYYCNKYNIKRYTLNGKTFTYNKLKHRINDHINKHKPKHEPFKTLLMSYFNDEINHEDFMYNFINIKTN